MLDYRKVLPCKRHQVFYRRREAQDTCQFQKEVQMKIREIAPHRIQCENASNAPLIKPWFIYPVLYGTQKYLAEKQRDSILPDIRAYAVQGCGAPYFLKAPQVRFTVLHHFSLKNRKWLEQGHRCLGGYSGYEAPAPPTRTQRMEHQRLVPNLGDCKYYELRYVFHS